MSKFETKPGTGALFKNDRKKEDRDPDYTGNYTDLQGQECYFDAWLNMSEAGKKYMKVRTKPKVAKVAPSTASVDDDGSDIPF